LSVKVGRKAGKKKKASAGERWEHGYPKGKKKKRHKKLGKEPSRYAGKTKPRYVFDTPREKKGRGA